MNTLALNPAATRRNRILSVPVRINRSLNCAEDMVVALALAAMMFLPIAEMTLRSLLGTGIENINSLIQHMTLVVGTMGAAVAARQNQLLAFAGTQFLPRKPARYARFYSQTITAVVCAMLFAASLDFIAAERSAGLIVAYGIPVWIMQTVMPAAFGIIAFRSIVNAAHSNWGIIAALLTVIAIVFIISYAPAALSSLNIISFAGLVAAALLGAPVFVIVAGLSLTLIWTEGMPLASMSVNHYSLVSNHLLPSIPLFTLAGYFLAESKAPERFIELFNAWFGQFRWGPVIIAVTVATFFTCFTGASGVTILALGGLLMPLLISAGYSKKGALGLVTGGGSAGVLLMPALPLILYAIIAEVTIQEMFIGSLLPAILMYLIVALWGLYLQNGSGSKPVVAFNTRRALHAVWTAKWELLLPAVLLTGLFSGVMTPLEASAVTAFYAFIVEVLIHRDISLRYGVIRVLVQCALLTGGILLILGVALGLTSYMVDAEIPDLVIEWVQETIKNPWLFLLALNGFLLLIGCFVDIYSAIIVFAPLIIPIGISFGINPVHLGIIFLANMELGYLTPPVGMNLFFASSRFGQPLLAVCRAVVPLFFMLLTGVLIITYVPWLSTALLMFLH